jgi:hypothetical protein
MYIFFYFSLLKDIILQTKTLVIKKASAQFNINLYIATKQDHPF